MSTELDAKGPLAMTQFFGGADRGSCLQLTSRICGARIGAGSWVGIRFDEVPALIADLQAVVDGTIGEDRD